MANLVDRVDELTDNFDGENEYDQFGDAYTGQNDPDIYFPDSSVSSFEGERDSQIEFSMTINNTYTTDKKIAILNSIFDVMGVNPVTLSGNGETVTPTLHHHNVAHVQTAFPTIDAMIDDGTVLTDGAGHSITVTGTDKTVREWLNYIKSNSIRVPRMKIASSNTAAYQKKLIFRERYPFQDVGETIISLSNFYKANQQQDKFIDVEREVQINAKTLAVLEIPASTAVTITFFIGSVASNDQKLETRAKVAKANITKIRRFYPKKK